MNLLSKLMRLMLGMEAVGYPKTSCEGAKRVIPVKRARGGRVC